MNIVQEMLSNICRLCTNQVAEGTELHNIFEPSQTGYPQMLSRVIWVTNLEIWNGDGLPTNMCSECSIIINLYYKFKQRCYVSDRDLRIFLKNLEGEVKDLITINATELDNNINDELGSEHGSQTSNTKNNTNLAHRKIPSKKSCRNTSYPESSSNKTMTKIQEMHNIDTKLLEEKNKFHFSTDHTNKQNLNTNDTCYKKQHSSEIGVPKSTSQKESGFKNIPTEMSNKNVKTKLESSKSNLTQKSSVQVTVITSDINRKSHHKLLSNELSRKRKKSCETSELLTTNSKSSDIKVHSSKRENFKVKTSVQLENKKSHCLGQDMARNVTENICIQKIVESSSGKEKDISKYRQSNGNNTSNMLEGKTTQHNMKTITLKHLTNNKEVKKEIKKGTEEEKRNKNIDSVNTNGSNQNEQKYKSTEDSETSVVLVERKTPVLEENVGLPTHEIHGWPQNTHCSKLTNNEKSENVQDTTLSKKSTHHKIKQVSANSKAPLKRFTVQQIPQEKLHINVLKNMLKAQFEVKRYTCKDCGKSYAHNGPLKAHIRRDHTGETPFSCHDCGKKFVEKRQVKRHIESKHVTDKPFKCKCCPKSYFNKKELDNHERFHNNDRPYKCSVCPKAYTTNRNLQVHLSTHLGERNFHCPLCDKSFWLKSILKSHILTHNKERTVSCPLCKKTFATQRALKSHNITHTKERPYKCKLCPSTYAYQDNLREHMRKHNGDTFNCSVCRRPFIKKTKLRHHLLMHTGKLYFECIPCGKTFSSKGSWVKHMKKPHKKVTTSSENRTDVNKDTSSLLLQT